jgi:hypothetical protein
MPTRIGINPACTRTAVIEDISLDGQPELTECLMLSHEHAASSYSISGPRMRPRSWLPRRMACRAANSLIFTDAQAIWTG